MKKKIYMILSILIAAGIITTLILVGNTKIAQSSENDPAASKEAEFNAEVSIDTKQFKEIPLGMTGHHSEMGGQPYRWDAPELIEKASQYDGLGYVRVAGTNLNAYDWKTGAYSEENVGQLQSDDKSYYIYISSLRTNEAKGGDTIDQLRQFLHQSGTRAIIPVNVFTNDVRQIGDLAKYCYENHVPVLYFELGNEVSFYTGDAGYNRSDRFDTGTDYLERMKSYNDEIKKYYPGAKTVVAMDNTRKNSFDEDFRNFPNPYWDAVTTHKFQPDGNDINSAIAATNDGLNFWQGYIDHYVAYSNNARIGIGEQSTALAGTLSMTHYNGIAIAESMLRLSAHPNVDYVQSWRIPSGIAVPAFDYSNKFQDAYQRNQQFDPFSLTFKFYDSAPAVSARIVDSAINNSNQAYNTVLTGGTTVPTKSVKIPALTSQAYRGINGKDYLVIVNKSSSSHNVNIKKDNAALKLPMTKTYVTASPNSKNNTASKPVTMKTEEIKAGDPVFVPAYSVTSVEWVRSKTPDAPPAPWLSYVNVQNNSVDLKWQRSVNATGYKIKYGTEPEDLSKEVDVKDTTSYTVTDLQSGSTYYFAAAAYNTSGISAYSDSNPSNTVAAKLDKPGIPLVTKSHYEKSGRAVIEWQSVPDAVGYKLKYGSDPGSYTDVIDVGNNVGKIVDGLIDGQPYYFAVSAYNNIGEGENSSEVSVTPQAGIPLSPHDLTITPKTGSATLSWLKTRGETDSEYFENGNADWNNVSGAWDVTDHPSTGSDTKVYKSSGSGTEISLFAKVNTGDLEGDVSILVNGTYGSDSQVGLIARYSNENSYYRLLFDSKSSKFKLIKQTPDGPMILAEETKARTKPPSDMELKLELRGNQIICRLGSDNIFDKNITDSSPLPQGYFGLYTSNQTAYFDEVRIRRPIGTFNVYRSTKALDDFSLVASGIEGTSWEDNDLEQGKTYFYRVTAVNNGFESYQPSNTVRKN